MTAASLPETDDVRRLLIINPNTNLQVTRQIAGHACDHVARAAQADGLAGVAVEVVNPSDGPFSIETAADRNSAVPAVLDLVRAAPDRDGYVLACFDDIAVDEARAIVTVPVISMAQAAIEAAVRAGGRFAIVTTVAEQVPTIDRLLRKYGAADQATVRACGIGVAEASRRTGPAETMLDRQICAAMDVDGASAIVLGSGAYAGRAGALAAAYGIPFIDGLTAAIERLSQT